MDIIGTLLWIALGIFFAYSVGSTALENIKKYKNSKPNLRKLLSDLTTLVVIGLLALISVGAAYVINWRPPETTESRNCFTLTRKAVPVTAVRGGKSYTLTADFENAVPKNLNFTNGGHVDLTESQKNKDGVLLVTDENGDDWMILIPEGSCDNS